MSAQTITVELPEGLYHRLLARAEHAQRGIDEELIDTLDRAVPPADGIPAELVEVVAGLRLLPDTALWRVARQRFSRRSAAELERLHIQRQRKPLSAPERQRVADLLYCWQRHLLIRGEALALLKERGHDVSQLIKPS